MIVIFDGDEYVINGEKIFVIVGFCVIYIVVWVMLDKFLGCLVIKLFIVFCEYFGVIVE